MTVCNMNSKPIRTMLLRRWWKWIETVHRVGDVIQLSWSSKTK